MPRSPQGRKPRPAKPGSDRKSPSKKLRSGGKAPVKPATRATKWASPTAGKSGVHKPGARKPGANKSASSKQATGKPESREVASRKPGAGKPDITKNPRAKPTVGGRKSSRASDTGEKYQLRSGPRSGACSGSPAVAAKSRRKAALPVRPPSKQVRQPVRSAGPNGPPEPMRIARAIARAGLCSRREAERWIEEGRVSVNGRRLTTPGLEVGPSDCIKVDGAPMPVAEPVQLWRYHKPKGIVTTNSDPEGRATVFERLPEGMPRVVSIGRLDFNTEGLLLLTNDGALSRHLELPSTGWLRRYRVRVWGDITQADLDKLKNGITVEGRRYGPIEATLDKIQASNAWLTIGLREGKNREVRKVLSQLGLEVNRLIRISYGPFQLSDLKPGEVEPVRRRILVDQLGPRLASEFGLGKDSEPNDVRRGRKPKRPRNDD